MNPFTMCCSSRGLQAEHEAAGSRQQAEVKELENQLSRLNSLVERGNQALQRKTQVRNVPLHLRTLSKDLKCVGKLLINSEKSEGNTPETVSCWTG